MLLFDIYDYETVESRLRRLLFRQAQVPDDYLGLVYRGPRFARFIEPGRFNRAPRLLTEKLVGYLSLRPNSFSFRYGKIQSADGYLFAISGKLNYRFDPREAHDRGYMRTLLQMILNHPQSLHKPIEALLSRQLKRMVGNQSALQLMAGERVAALEHRLERGLRAELSPLGILLEPTGGLVIEKLLPPVELSEGKRAGLRRLLEMASGSSDLSDRELERYLQLMWSENSRLQTLVENNSERNRDEGIGGWGDGARLGPRSGRPVKLWPVS